MLATLFAFMMGAMYLVVVFGKFILVGYRSLIIRYLKNGE